MTKIAKFFGYHNYRVYSRPLILSPGDTNADRFQTA